MKIHALQPPEPPVGDPADLEPLLSHAGVAKDSRVRVAGPAGPAAMIWLCRHGYEDVVYVHGNHAGAAEEPADVLLIPHAEGPQDLLTLLQEGDRPKVGGLLVARTAGWNVDGGLSARLHALGYDLEMILVAGPAATHIARWRGHGLSRKAA